MSPDHQTRKPLGGDDDLLAEMLANIELPADLYERLRIIPERDGLETPNDPGVETTSLRRPPWVPHRWRLTRKSGFGIVAMVTAATIVVSFMLGYDVFRSGSSPVARDELVDQGTSVPPRAELAAFEPVRGNDSSHISVDLALAELDRIRLLFDELDEAFLSSTANLPIGNLPHGQASLTDDDVVSLTLAAVSETAILCGREQSAVACELQAIIDDFPDSRGAQWAARIKQQLDGY